MSKCIHILFAWTAATVLAWPAMAIAQEVWRSDGNWWVTQSEEQRVTYLSGVMDGLALQERLVLRSHMDLEGDRSIVRQRQSEAMSAPRRLLRNLNSNQIRDGLDVFYKDFRNRQITVPNAMQLVIYQINAEPQAMLDALLDSMRRRRD